MPLFTPRAFDDRGREVTYLDPMFHGSQVNRATRQRLNRRTDARQRVIFAVIFASLLLQAVRLVSSPIPVMVTNLALAVAFTAFVWFLVLPAVRHRLWSRDWKARYKAAGHCPACQYDLRGLEAEADGCTICPECGGAWAMPETGLSS